MQFNDPSEIWERMPTLLAGELLVAILFSACLFHAVSTNRNHIVVICTVTCVSMAASAGLLILPALDVQWHARATVMASDRIPLYILCAQAAFLYVSIASMWRLKIEAWSQAAGAGIAAGSIHLPFEMVGGRFLWWTWHDSHASVFFRLLGVPFGSLSTFAALASSLSFLLRITLPSSSSSATSLPQALFALVSSSLLSVPLAAIQLAICHLDDQGVPTTRSTALQAALSVMLFLNEPCWGFFAIRWTEEDEDEDEGEDEDEDGSKDEGVKPEKTDGAEPVKKEGVKKEAETKEEESKDAKRKKNKRGDKRGRQKENAGEQEQKSAETQEGKRKGKNEASGKSSGEITEEEEAREETAGGGGGARRRKAQEKETPPTPGAEPSLPAAAENTPAVTERNSNGLAILDAALRGRSRADAGLHVGVLVVLASLNLLLATNQPADHLSLAWHQSTGPCRAPAHRATGLWERLYPDLARWRFEHVCPEKHRGAYSFDCAAILPPSLSLAPPSAAPQGAAWYPICGSQEQLDQDRIGASCALCFAGIALFSLLLRDGSRREEAAGALTGAEQETAKKHQ